MRLFILSCLLLLSVVSSLFLADILFTLILIGALVAGILGLYVLMLGKNWGTGILLIIFSALIANSYILDGNGIPFSLSFVSAVLGLITACLE